MDRRVMEEFSSYPNDHEHLLDGLVLSIHGFEEAEPRKMHVCDECFRSLKVDRIPEAALANGFWARPSSATTPKKQQQQQQQHAQDFFRPNPTSDSADDPTTANSPGWPSATYKAGSVPCGVGHGVPRPCSASRLAEGHARADSYMSKRELSSYTQGNTRGCRKEENKSFARPAPTDYGLASKASRFFSSPGCGWMEGDVSASFFRHGESAAAGAVSHYPGRQPSSWCKATTAVSSSGADRPGMPPVCDSTTPPAVALGKVNPSKAFCQRFGHGQRTANARRECDGLFRDAAPAAAAAAATAPATPIAAAATETAATAAAAIPDSLNAHRGRRRTVSRAAVEAWAAAETWASTLAVATSAVASGGGQVNTDTATDNVEGTRSGVFGRVVESSRQRCGDDADVVEGLGKGDGRCFFSSDNCCGASGRVCCQRAAVHWNGRVHHGSPLRGEAAVASGCHHHRVAGGSSRCTRDAPSRVSSHALLGERHEDSSFNGGRGASVDTEISSPMGLQGAAAAIVIWRIDRGEQSWRRHAKRVGLAAFRAHCLQMGRWKRRGAMANKHWERASKARGFRGMEAVVRRGGRRREAATAVAAADVLTRARRMRKILVMLRRNWQVCVALRSRDDVADLHFAECRLPGATRTWREQALVGRSCRNAGILANRERRSKSLRIALTQWASHSLGDRERRRKVFAWRGALLSSHRRRIADGFGVTFGITFGVGEERDDDGNRPRHTHVQGGPDGNRTQDTDAELPGESSSTSLPTKLNLPWRSLSTTAGVTTTTGFFGRPRINGRAAITECAGRTDLGDGCVAQEHATRDGEQPITSADIGHEDMFSAAAGSVSAASQARRTLSQQASSADVGNWFPEARMAARATCDAHAVGGDEEDGFREHFEGKQNRSCADAASTCGFGSVGSVDASRCTTQGGISKSSAGADGTMEGSGRGEEAAPLLAHEAAVDVDINKTAESDETRGGPLSTSTQLKAAVAADNAATVVVQKGSMGCFDCGGGGVYDRDERRRYMGAQGDVREFPSVAVASPGRVGDLQDTEAADDIVVNITCVKPTTVNIDVGAGPDIGSERGMLEGSVEYQRSAEEEEEEEEEEEGSARRIPIAAAADRCKVDDIDGCASVGNGHSSTVQMGALGIPDAEDLAVASLEKPEANEKDVTLPPTGKEDSGRVLPRDLGTGEITVCETGDCLFRQYSTLFDEAIAVVNGGAEDASVSGRGARQLPRSQVDDMSQGGAQSAVTSEASSSVSLSTHPSRVAATRQSRSTRGVFSKPKASFVNSNDSHGEFIAGPCTLSDGSDSVELSVTGFGSGKEGQRTLNAEAESRRATQADVGDVPSLYQEIALRAEGHWGSKEGSSFRSLHGSGVPAEAHAGYVCSEWTPGEGATCTRSDICYGGTQKSARKREEEVEITAKIRDCDGCGAGMPSAPNLAPQDLEGHHPLNGSSAATPDVRAAHDCCLRPRSTEEGVEHHRLENNKKAMPARHTSTDEDESEDVPTCAASRVSPSPVPVYRGGQGEFNSGVEHTMMVGGVLESLSPPPADAARFEIVSTGDRRSSLFRQPTGRRASTKNVMVDSTEKTATMSQSQREHLDRLRSLSTKQSRHTQLEDCQPVNSPPENFPPENSPPGSSENLETVLANLGEGGVAVETAARPKLAVSVRGRGIPQDELSPLYQPKRAASSYSGEETGVKSNEQGGVVLLACCPRKGRPLSSELSSISWSDRFEGGTQKQPSSLGSTEESTEKGTLDGDRLGLSSSVKQRRSTVHGDELLSHVLPRTVSAEEDDDFAAVVARKPIGLRSSPEEKKELVESKVAAFLPPTDRHHVPASTKQTGRVSVPSTAVETQHDECQTPPRRVEHPRGVRCSDAKELQERLSNTDRSVRMRDDRCERRDRQQLSSKLEQPDQAPRSSHSCADTVVSSDLRPAARSQEESGRDGMAAGTARATSTVVPNTIETTTRVYGTRSCTGGDSVETPVPGVLPSSESGSLGDSDGSGGGLPASCDFQTRVGLDGGDGTHPRVTGDRQSSQNSTATCGGLLRNRSSATVTRPKSGQGIGSPIDCEPGVAPSSPELPPPEAASTSTSSQGDEEDTTRSANRVRKRSISTTGRESTDQQVGGSRIIAQDGLQEPPPPSLPPGSLSTCSVGGKRRPPRKPESNVSSGGGGSGVGDGGRPGLTTGGGGKGPDKATLKSTSTSSSRGSCRRRRRDTLEERVSEAFLRRRLQAIGFRAWHLQLVTSTARRCSAYSLGIRASTFAKRVALTKWRTANATLLAAKAAEKARRCEIAALLRLGPRLTSTTIDSTAVAIVALRRWHRRSAARTLLSRAFCAWVSRTRASRSVEACRGRVLARHGLFVWQRAAQEAAQLRARSRAVAEFMVRAAGKRRLRAWRQRRKRQTGAIRVAEAYRAGTGTGNNPAAAAAQRWRRSERLRARGALRGWVVEAKERAVLRVARLAVLSRVENRQRVGATRAWRALAGDMRRRRCSRSKGDAQYAGRLGVQGLRGLRGGILHERAWRDALEVGDAHWKRRGAMLIVETLRDLLDSRMRAFHRAETLRLRAVARARLKSWRRVARTRSLARSALEKADSRLRKRTGKAILSALSAYSDWRIGQDRATRIGQQHLSCRRISTAVTAWRVWTRRQAAGFELYAAAGALHKSWAVSAGLRALDRVARARMARRDASRVAEQYLLRTSGLGRWRAATAARRHEQGQTRVATLHWARNLSVKVWVSWQVATVQQWARSRQEEAAAQHERRGCKKRALRAWVAFVSRRALPRDRSQCCSGGGHCCSGGGQCCSGGGQCYSGGGRCGSGEGQCCSGGGQRCSGGNGSGAGRSRRR